MNKKIKYTLEGEKKIVDFAKSIEILHNVKNKRFHDPKTKHFFLLLQLANELAIDGTYLCVLYIFQQLLLANIFAIEFSNRCLIVNCNNARLFRPIKTERRVWPNINSAWNLKCFDFFFFVEFFKILILILVPFKLGP